MIITSDIRSPLAESFDELLHKPKEMNIIDYIRRYICCINKENNVS